MDLRISEYPTYVDLEHYMYGSASVIGLQMVPILEPINAEAGAYAHRLGVAFQLTNFIRDIGEDLERGRIYLPIEDLDTFSVSREDLQRRRTTRSIRELVRFEVDRARAIYSSAHPGIAMLHPTSRQCVETAFILYGEILTEIERQDYDVFAQRARVGIRRRLSVALPRYLQARRGGHRYVMPSAPGEPLGESDGEQRR
jgi:15-cis-phytoene synthase